MQSIGYSPDEIGYRLETGSIFEIHRGIYVIGHWALTQHSYWIAAVLAAGPSAVLSHRDALVLWGLSDFRRPDIEVTLPGLGSRRRPGIRIHRTRRLDPLDVVSRDRIPVTSLPRTLLDVAGSIGRRHLREAYIAAQRDELIDPYELQRVLDNAGPKRGAGVLRRLAEEDMSRLKRTKSPLEGGFLDFCRRHGIPEPIPNAVVHGYEVDAFWPHANLVVELDSWEWHRDREAFERDRAKIGDLRLFGVDVVPVTSRRMMNNPTQLARILRSALAVAVAATPPPSPSEADSRH